MRLDPAAFDPRTHVALTYVRQLLTSREGAPPELREEFEATFSVEERRYVLASMKGMFCTNLLVNEWRWAYSKLPGRAPLSGGETCPL